MKRKESALGPFCDFCSKIKTAEDFEKLFALFLTFEEREALSARFLIVQELLKGEHTQREIAEKYKVSIAQITRGSNALKIIDDDLLTFLKKNF